ncbi:hypothetical protein TrVE_jg6909 [Triparma verrucosa]|uniref:Mitochondrial carrier protein n=1 Tax=Triparma verrucosa TaxID=1606542 RepID=A0A9W7BG00_9STRA|nr:hypothetical protein TrVE_jg6909 [Triparma verrucosa]
MLLLLLLLLLLPPSLPLVPPSPPYPLISLAGSLSCSLTHALVTPLDSTKTNLQTTPSFSTLTESFLSLKKKQQLFKGFKPTVIGYGWYGATVYPTYEFLKHLDIQGDPMIVSLVSGGSAAVVASIGLCPMENWRIGMFKGQKSRGYDGFGSLLGRQVVFGSVKFLAFEEFRQKIMEVQPEVSSSVSFGLLATILAGLGSGVLSCYISQPFDTMLTALTSSKLGVVETFEGIMDEDGIVGLWRGVKGRAVWSGLIIGGQFFLYDIFKEIVGVNGGSIGAGAIEVAKEFEQII